jgi:hypothetical protein
MKPNSRTLLAFAALSPLVLTTGWSAESVTYGPKAGSTLTKHAAIGGELELEDMSLEVNGQDLSEMAQVQMAMKIELKVSVTDRYEAVADGRPTKLVRTFDEVSSNTHTSGNNPMAGSEEKDTPLESELEGKSVAFTWDGDAYEVTFEGEAQGDEELLTGLEEDLDLRGFLPSSEVSKGDKWNVPSEAVKRVLAPGGDVKLRPEGGGDSDPMGAFSQNDLIGELSGTFEATYGGTRDEDGVKVAVIQLSIEAHSAQDLSSRLDEMREQMKESLPEGVSVELEAMDMEYELEAEGELLWNLETGLVHALQLSGDLRLLMDQSMSMKMGEESQDMDISMTFTGNQTLTLTTGE